MIKVEDGGLHLVTDNSSQRLDARTIFVAMFEPTSDEHLRLRHLLTGGDLNLRFEAQVSHPSLRVVKGRSNSVELELGLHNSEFVFKAFPKDAYVIDKMTWRPLDQQQFSKIEGELEAYGVTIGETLTPEAYTKLAWTEALEVEILAEPRAIFASFENQSIEPINPKILTGALFPYQESGSKFALASVKAGRGVLLADEMGLGKTLQAIYVLGELSVRRLPGSPTSLVIVPSSNLANWLNEFAKFAPNIDLKVHYGPDRAGMESSLELGDVLITTYDLVSIDLGFLEEIDWGLVVIDEAQNIKNPLTQRSQAVSSLSKSSGMAITGTPIENSLTDLWGIFNFVEPGQLGTLELFKLSYPDTPAAASLLSQQIAPFTVRRSVDDVADDLPEKIEHEVPIFTSSEMNRLYAEFRGAENTPEIGRLQNLRVLCSLASHGSSESAKLTRLMSLLDEVVAGKHKAIVFTSFTDSINGIVDSIRSTYPHIFVDSLDGRKTAARRQEVIDEFSNYPYSGVLVANPMAAGVGLNIQAANYVFHFTPEWNPASVSQATSRVFRRGQTKPVFVYHLFFKDTVEEYMREVLESKRELFKEGLSAFNEDSLARWDMSEALSRVPTTKNQ